MRIMTIASGVLLIWQAQEVLDLYLKYETSSTISVAVTGNTTRQTLSVCLPYYEVMQPDNMWTHNRDLYKIWTERPLTVDDMDNLTLSDIFKMSPSEDGILVRSVLLILLSALIALVFNLI